PLRRRPARAGRPGALRPAGLPARPRPARRRAAALRDAERGMRSAELKRDSSRREGSTVEPGTGTGTVLDSACRLPHSAILEKAVGGNRLTAEEGLALFGCRDLAALGRAADAVCRRLHPEPYRTYNIDRNVNYTNVCAAVCDFCAFYRKGADADAYVLPREVLYQKIEETIALGGDQILMQGGNHPSLRLEWYEDLLRDLRARYPAVNLHAFSASEIWHFHKLNKLPLREVLQRLKDAGMGSLPGGGAEILTDRVRKAITVNKVLTEEWLEVHRVWHELGGRSTCTMMFGHVETLAERIEHLERLRQLQDETGGFTAFICWT